MIYQRQDRKWYKTTVLADKSFLKNTYMESELFLEALLGTHFPEGNDI
jgi:hypothetical protein